MKKDLDRNGLLLKRHAAVINRFFDYQVCTHQSINLSCVCPSIRLPRGGLRGENRCFETFLDHRTRAKEPMKNGLLEKYRPPATAHSLNKVLAAVVWLFQT